MTLSLNFCLREREIQALMRKLDIVFGTDEDGDTIISLAGNFISKNQHGGLDGSAFFSAGVIRDKMQVSAIQRYLSHLHPDCDRLFYRAVSGGTYPMAEGNAVCYIKCPLSHNILGRMMSNISAACGIWKYTNHCLRATAFVRMKSEGIEDRKICAVSAHKNPNSLSSYERVSSSDVRRLADAIDCKPKL